MGAAPETDLARAKVYITSSALKVAPSQPITSWRRLKVQVSVASSKDQLSASRPSNLVKSGMTTPLSLVAPSA